MSVSEASSAPGDLAGQVPLSYNQEFLCMFDQGDDDGPFGPKYNIVAGWRLSGKVDLGALQGALRDVVARHEALRTEVVRGEVRYQRILEPSTPELTVRDFSDVAPEARDRRAEELLNELETGLYSIALQTTLRAVYARFDDEDSVLALIAHHTAVDGWAMQVLIRDLEAFYALRAGHPAPELPEVHQYQEYARWQLETFAETAATTRRRDYWRENLHEAQMLAMRTDHPRSAGLEKSTGWHRFLIERDVATAALELSKSTRSSPFIVLLAAYNVVLRRRTGATDIVVPTFTPGRDARFYDTIGSFFNFLPLRTDLDGCATFREVLDRTRKACITAYSRELPFGHVLQEAPALMAPLAEDDRAVWAFQVAGGPVSSDAGERREGPRFEEIRRRLMSQPVGIDVPDGALWSLDLIPTGEIVGSVGFNSNLFREGTIRSVVDEFRRLLGIMVKAPDAPLP